MIAYALGRTLFGNTTSLICKSLAVTCNPNRAREVGYTHLIGGAKRNEKWLKRLEERVARDYPAQYERCMRYVKKLGLRA